MKCSICKKDLSKDGIDFTYIDESERVGLPGREAVIAIPHCKGINACSARANSMDSRDDMLVIHNLSAFEKRMAYQVF